MFLVFGWIWIISRRNRIAIANFSIQTVDSNLTPSGIAAELFGKNLGPSLCVGFCADTFCAGPFYSPGMIFPIFCYMVIWHTLVV